MTIVMFIVIKIFNCRRFFKVMEKVSRKIKTIFSVIFTFAGVFILLAVGFILPIYYVSEYFPQAYSVTIVCLAVIFVLRE